MTSHELARQLLATQDTVVVQHTHSGNYKPIESVGILEVTEHPYHAGQYTVQLTTAKPICVIAVSTSKE